MNSSVEGAVHVNCILKSFRSLRFAFNYPCLGWHRCRSGVALLWFRVFGLLLLQLLCFCFSYLSWNPLLINVCHSTMSSSSEKQQLACSKPISVILLVFRFDYTFYADESVQEIYSASGSSNRLSDKPFLISVMPWPSSECLWLLSFGNLSFICG